MNDEQRPSPGEPTVPVAPAKTLVSDNQPIGAVHDFTGAWTREAGAASAHSPKHGAPPRLRKLAINAAILAVLAAVAVLVVLDVRDYRAKPAVERSLPKEVQGTWFTSAPQYASRRLELLSRGLLFQIGGATSLVTRHDIIRVERFPQAQGTLYHVEYVDAGAQRDDPLVLEFIYRPGEPAEIVFPHQRDIVWTRVRTATTNVVQGAAEIPDVPVLKTRPH